MKTPYKLFIIGLTALLASGCEKYVDIKTQGNLVPTEAINYRYLLNGSSNFESNPNLSDFASDDININDAAQINGLTGSLFYGYFINSYTWRPVIYTLGTTNEQDDNWNRMYSNILTCNTIIAEVPTATGTDAEKAEMIAEAKVHRADAYLVLVNTYAKPYNSATAATDLGLPLMLTQTVSQSLKRASVQAVYNQIIDDLTTALPSLPNSQAYNTLPSKVSAYGELARCYLYMNDYANANKYADLALALRSTLNDLSVLTSVTSSTYPRRIVDPEILLSKIAFGNALNSAPIALKLSDDLLSVLGTTDQRYTLFTVPASTISSTYTGRYSYRESRIGENRNVGPNVPEMMLIKAEYFARNNDATNAMLWVNNLRVKRFKAADYRPLTASSPADALVKVIEERRREFFCRMLRWWDMRRLKSETAFQKTYTRTVSGVTYTLAPNSDRYTFPIADVLINLNPELEKNP
ncbi:SusD-like starch-binding protein associating with outer membrane [Pedobacter psychrotolerans]|uniref:Membrane protein n=1 Tax=Pedobacter psychrotolerans TaxID=1843235 RepID=A0A4R2HHW2_9SPHI|nr:RagB/SusD family nutrient uptake outer membrane protein [Pedobacter psychrotolerans]TCO28834.1 SusD-like starch-binding protein associating with outer membrane [Pedobacter psychrotolerans]GGE52128.1 membrane protein [Pedobacter psychrotolerans]